MVVFGGYWDESPQLKNDVWELPLEGAPTWHELLPLGTPPPPQEHGAVAYDPIRGRLILFGGYDVLTTSAGHARSDVWELSLGDTLAWTERHPGGSAVPALYGCATAYDATRDRLLVFGGRHESPLGPPQQDTWALDLAGDMSWSLIDPPGGQPPARVSARGAYDPVRDRFIVFGGLQADTWALSFAGAGQWTALEPGDASVPGPRNSHAAVYDATRDQVLMFGGRLTNYNGGHHFQWYKFADLWKLTFEPRAVWSLIPSATSPPGRWGHTMILDPVTDELLVFGGAVWNTADVGPEALPVNELWRRPLSTGGDWQRVDTGDSLPTPRYYHSAVFDPVRRRMLVFGGYDDRQEWGDLWALSLDGARRWTRLNVGGPGPSPRLGHAAVYDPVGDRMILFGGTHGDLALNDTWQLPLSEPLTWAPLPSAVRPPGRANAALVFDSIRNRLVLFGGSANAQVFDAGAWPDSSDTWILPLAPGASWAPASLSGPSPGDRTSPAAVFDTKRDQTLVLQGRRYEFQTFDSVQETWALTSSALVPAPPALVHAQAGPYRVVLEWQGRDGAPFSASIERRVASAPWATLGTVHADANGRLHFEDPTAVPQTHYAYRLKWQAGAAVGMTPVVELDVPRLGFALIGATPNPSRDGLTVALSLPDGAAARLEAWDVSGRRVVSRDVGSLGPGDHVVTLVRPGVLPPGLYLLRLSRAGNSQVTRACIVR
jgi:hypothetical protein